jgi:hypothetical protein
MTIATGVAAGWYADPQQPTWTLRYWNGSAWTEHVAPRVQGPPSSSGYPGQAPYGSVSGGGEQPSDPLHWVVPAGRSWQTIAAGYVGLVSLLVFPLGPVAIALGALGLRAASRQGSHGRGRAIFGIVAGCIGSFFGILLLGELLNGPS